MVVEKNVSSKTFTLQFLLSLIGTEYTQRKKKNAISAESTAYLLLFHCMTGLQWNK